MALQLSSETGHGPPYLKENGHGPPISSSTTSPSEDQKPNDLRKNVIHVLGNSAVDIEGTKTTVSTGAVAESPLEHDLLTAMSSKNEEILRLRSDMQMLQGKIKGYQTLGHLFQESKQECSRYKQKNDQLSLQLDIVMKRLSIDERQELEQFISVNSGVAPQSVTMNTSVLMTNEVCDPPVPEKGGGVPDKGGGRTDKVGLTANLSLNLMQDVFEIEQRPQIQNADLNLKQDKDVDRNLVEVSHQSSSVAMLEGDQSSADGRPMDLYKSKSRDAKSSEHSSASSPSFVQINSMADQSELENEENLSPNTSNVSSAENDTELRESSNVEMNDIKLELQAAGLQSSAENGLSAEIRQLSDHLNDPAFPQESKSFAADLIRISVKAIKVEKNIRIKQSLLDQKDVELRTLKERNEMLHQELQVLRGKQQRFDEMMITQQAMIGETGSSTNSMEWVEVQRGGGGGEHGASAAVGDSGAIGEVGCELLITAESVHERTYKHQISYLTNSLQELTHTNRQLQDKCQQLQEDGARRETVFQLHVENARKELLEEKESRRKLEEQYTALTATKTRLERELAVSLSAPQLEPAYFLKSSDQPVAVSTSPADSDLKIQMEILAQQVTVFKEDFDQERRDREQAKTETELYKQRFNEINEQLNQANHELRHRISELAIVNGENAALKIRLKQAVDALELFQRQGRPADISPQLQAVLRQPVSQQQFVQHPISPASDTPLQQLQQHQRLQEQLHQQRTAHQLQQQIHQQQIHQQQQVQLQPIPLASDAPLQQLQQQQRLQEQQHQQRLAQQIHQQQIHQQQQVQLQQQQQQLMQQQLRQHTGFISQQSAGRTVTPSSSPHHVSSVGGKTWSCLTCTYANPEMALRCEICQTSKRDIRLSDTRIYSIGGAGAGTPTFQCDTVGRQHSYGDNNSEGAAQVWGDVEIDSASSI